jgi:hypothetical protein
VCNLALLSQCLLGLWKAFFFQSNAYGELQLSCFTGIEGWGCMWFKLTWTPHPRVICADALLAGGRLEAFWVCLHLVTWVVDNMLKVRMSQHRTRVHSEHTHTSAHNVLRKSVHMRHEATAVSGYQSPPVRDTVDCSQTVGKVLTACNA